MKLIKKLLKFLMWTVVVLLAIVVAIPLWIGPVVKQVANRVVPSYTQTNFHLGDFGLGYTGFFHTGDLQLENPKGYDQREAFTLGKLEVKVDPASLFTDVIHVERITIKDVFVSYVSRNGVNNFDQIKENCGVVKEPAADKKPGADKKPAADKKPVTDKKPADAKAAENRPAKKVIIDRVEISGVLVHLWTVTLPVPSLTIKDIGKASGGMTVEAAWDEVSASVMKSVGAISGGLDALNKYGVKLTADGLKSVNETTDKALKSANKAMESVNAVTGNATKSVSEATGKATKSVSEATGKATKSVSEATGKAADAVNDGVKALKGLFGN